VELDVAATGPGRPTVIRIEFGRIDNDAGLPQRMVNSSSTPGSPLSLAITNQSTHRTGSSWLYRKCGGHRSACAGVGTRVHLYVRRDAGPVNVQARAHGPGTPDAPGRRAVLASASDAEVCLGAAIADDEAAASQEVALPSTRGPAGEHERERRDSKRITCPNSTHCYLRSHCDDSVIAQKGLSLSSSPGRFRASAAEARRRRCDCHVRNAGDDRVKRIHHQRAVRQGLLLVEHHRTSGIPIVWFGSPVTGIGTPLIARPSIFESRRALPRLPWPVTSRSRHRCWFRRHSEEGSERGFGVNLIRIPDRHCVEDLPVSREGRLLCGCGAVLQRIAPPHRPCRSRCDERVVAPNGLAAGTSDALQAVQQQHPSLLTGRSPRSDDRVSGQIDSEASLAASL